MLISSNLPFSQWNLVFKDAMTTAAAIDRLVHYSVIVELNVASYRLTPVSGSFDRQASSLTQIVVNHFELHGMPQTVPGAGKDAVQNPVP